MSATDYSSGYTPRDFSGNDTYSANGTFPHSGDVTTGGWHLQRSGTNIFYNGELLTYTYTNGAGVWSHPHMGTSYSNGRIQLIGDPTNPNPANRIPEFDFLESDAFVAAGGGSGGGTLSTSYEGTLTVNGSNLNWAIPNAATTGNYELMSKVLPAGNFVQELPIAHTAYNGGSSGFVVNFDTSKQWILRAPDGVTLDTAGATPPPNEKKVFCNFW